MSKRTHKHSLDKLDCPCQSGLLFEQCCQPFLSTNSQQYPETAEQLMRSRYCAYVINNIDYLLKSWHSAYRPKKLELNNSEHQWIGLKIKSVKKGKKDDFSGTVHFIARYKINGKAYKLEENSLFEKTNHQWFYLKGVDLC